jgi:hypothetical protein
LRPVDPFPDGARWAEEARAYNRLIESWREIAKFRDTLPDRTATGPAQAELAV